MVGVKMGFDSLSPNGAKLRLRLKIRALEVQVLPLVLCQGGEMVNAPANKRAA